MRKFLFMISMLSILAATIFTNTYAGWTCEYASAKGNVFTAGGISICIAEAECVDENGREGSGQIFCQAKNGGCPDATTCAGDESVTIKEVSLTGSNEPTAR